MAIRRRRKKLTNLLSTLDRRVKSLEFRPIDLLSPAEAAAAASFDTIDVIVSDAAPNQYRPIEKAFFYPAAVSGSSPRVEVFFETNPDTKANDRFETSGVNGSASLDLGLSGDSLTVVSASSDPWDGDERKSYQYTPTEQESNLSNSVLYGTDVAAPEGTTQAVELLVKVEIASYQGSDTTIRINLNGPHKFKVGDVVYVELGVENPIVFGIDGLFRISNVDTNFIEYEIPTALAEPINVTPVVTVTRHVYAVGHKFVREGATWIDNSGSSDSVFVWRDIRWVSFSSYVGDDGVAPAPVTNLQGASESRAVNGIQAGVARITLTWTNPTTNAEGGPLDDLFGFEVWHRYRDADPWEKGDVVPGDDNEWTKDGFEVPKTVKFRVYALDSGGLKSEPAEIDVDTTTAAKEIKAPTPPQVEQYLGTPRFTWDGLQSDFTTPPSSAYEVEVHLSTIDNFSITNGSFPSGTYYGSFPAVPGGYLVVNANDLTDGANYYVRFLLRDIHGNSEVSGQASFTAKVDKPVTFDLIDVGTLTGQLITGLVLQTGPDVNGGPGVPDESGLILDQNGLRAYDDGGNITFNLNANTGSVSLLGSLNISGYAKTSDLTKAISGIDTNISAQEIADKINTLTEGSINETIVSPEGILTPVVATNTFIALNSDRDIKGPNTVIDGSKITTGTIDADRASIINIDADYINAGALRGRSVLTRSSSSSTAQRILMSGSSHTLKFYRTGDSDGDPRGTMEGVYGGLSIKGAGSLGARVTVGAGVLYVTTGSTNRPSLDMTGTGYFAYGASSSASRRPFLKLQSTSSRLKAPGTLGSTSELQLYSTYSIFRYKPLRVQDIAGSGTVAVFADSNGELQRGSSDARLKKNISPLEIGLDVVKKLQPVKFTWDKKIDNEDEEKIKNYGLLAQQVEEVLLEHGVQESSNLIYKFKNNSVSEKLPEDEDIYGMDYVALVPVLIKSIQELSKKVEDLETKLADKEGMN